MGGEFAIKQLVRKEGFAGFAIEVGHYAPTAAPFRLASFSCFAVVLNLIPVSCNEFQHALVVYIFLASFVSCSPFGTSMVVLWTISFCNAYTTLQVRMCVFCSAAFMILSSLGDGW